MGTRTIFVVFLLAGALASAQSGSPDALYERGINAITGVGETHNEQAAIDNFRRSADLGYGPAQIALGYYYEMGIAPGNQGQASVDLYKKAAVQGDPLAAWLAGRRYLLGIGIPQDMEAAKKWLKMSADRKNPFGAYYLGRMMAESDPAKAVALYKIAADQGLPQGQYYYGKALKEGRGIAPDRSSAYVWLNIALDAGHAAAGPELIELRADGHLSLDQINEAEAKSHELEQTVIRAVTARGCTGWEGEFAELPTPPPPYLQRFCH